MKKIGLLFFLIAALFFKMEIPSNSVELIIGAKTWYVTWLPWLRDAGQTAEDRYFGLQNTKDGGGWMYGGNAAVRVSRDISISVSYLYGVLGSDFEVSNTEDLDKGSGPKHTIQYQQRGHAAIYRHDLDSAVSYSLTDVFRIFAGYKYQPIKSKLRSVGAEHDYFTSQNYYNRISMDMEVQNHCPALGMGFVLPFENIFVFSINASALYLFGSMDYNHTKYIYENAAINNPPTDVERVKGKMELTGWGCNIEPAILVVVKENILLSLGFRWQMVVMKGVYKGESANITYSNMYDYVYGAFLNVMYRFN